MNAETLDFSGLLPDRTVPLMKQLELTLLALLVWAEARGEPEDGKRAVAHVVLNRFRKQSWMGGTVRDVILKPWQFSCFNSGDPNREKMMGVAGGVLWDQCARAAIGAYLGTSDDPVRRATHYCRHDCHPKWRNELTFVVKIGNHVFYR